MSDPESSRKDSPRHSPAPPLAPLEFLQSHRRGSITDPSLHAASTNSTSKLSATAFLSTDPRPSSNYVFGEASTHPVESNIAKLLRSPSLEKSDVYPDFSNKHQRSQAHVPVQSNNPKSDSNRLEPFNYNMRRHSIATSQDVHTHPPQGIKRKKSGDQNGHVSSTGEIDPQLVGPGVPSHLQDDPEAPAPKRRGSAIDSRSLAHPSVTERWWPNARRDVTLLSGTAALGGYPPGDSRLPGGMATFSWPSNPQTSDTSSQMHNPVDSAGMPRSFDPSVPLSMMPPGFAADRRMSVPAIPSSAQTRVLRSRSRTPSRQKQNGTSSASPGASASQEETGSSISKTAKDSATPYSRSPELRVSHKLAERKRRKEMKDLFDELRDQLPADRGMKASKWEILSKAIDFVAHLKTSHQEMIREIGMLRHELDAVRQGISPFPGPPPHAVVYAQGHMQGFQPDVLSPQSQTQSHPPRPASSPNAFTPDAGPSSSPLQNGSSDRVETPQS